MIEPATLQFLRDLQRHNAKDWFDANRARYDAAHDNMVEVAAWLITHAKRYDAALAGRDIDPRTCVSRLHRDMRFQRGRPPYKPDWYLLIGGDAQHGSAAGYHLRIMPAHSFAGGGLYTPNAQALLAIRQRIVARRDEWQALVDALDRTGLAPDGIATSGQLKTIPRGFDRDDAMAPYLRMKGYVVNCPLTNLALERDDAPDQIVARFAAAAPLVDFINRAVA